MTKIDLGLDTFGDVTTDAEGRLQPHAQVLRDVVAEAELADRLGVDFFGVGEHHRPDFAISAPEVVLAAIAGRTERIRLGTAVTILSTDDPVRVYQRFATLDAVSGARAERPPLSTWVGVGGSPESVVRAARYRFPLTLAIIGGDPRRFAPYIELYYRALAQLGSETLPVGVHSPGHIAETDAQAREELW